MRRVSEAIGVSALLLSLGAGCGSSDENGEPGTGGSGGSARDAAGGSSGASGAGGARSDAAADAILDAPGTADRNSEAEGSTEVGDAGAESHDAPVDVSSDATIDETTTDTKDAALDQTLDAASEPSSDGNVSASDIIYVDNANGTCTSVGADGSASHPYCQIAQAVSLLTVSSRHYVKVAGSTSSYDPLDFDSTPLTASFTGPGRDATPPATILGGSGISALLLDPLNGSLNLTFDGFVFSQSGNNASTILCSGGNTAPALVIRNSAILNGRKGITAQLCNAVITETIIASASQDGASFETGSTWMLENDVIHHCGIALSVASQGVARFNTLAANGASNLAGGVSCFVSQLFEDSIIATNTQNAGGSQFSGSCSLDHVVTGSDSIVSTGKIAGQPVFVGTFDFHLSVGNPASLAANAACCIDKQPAAPPNPTVDFERDPRPRGAAFDLGADEAN